MLEAQGCTFVTTVYENVQWEGWRWCSRMQVAFETPAAAAVVQSCMCEPASSTLVALAHFLQCLPILMHAGFLEPRAGQAMPAPAPAAEVGSARTPVQSSLTAALTTIGET